MIEAKDTVMSVVKYNQVSKAWHIENDVMELYSDIDYLNRHDIHLLETQAEISVKAGMKEVVEWIEDKWKLLRPPSNFAKIELDYNGWQAFKKKLGIEQTKGERDKADNVVS